MARGGTITPRPLADGSPAWVLMWRVSGRRVKRTVRGTRKDAEAALTAALAARDRGEQRKVSTETFETHANRWLVAKKPRLEASTYADYEAHVRLRLVPAFGKLRLRDLTRHRIEAYIAAQHASRKVSVKSINNSLIPLRQILARCVRDGYIANNPAASDDTDNPLRVPYEQPQMRHFDRDQAAAYLAAASPAYRPLAELLISTGLRIGEAGPRMGRRRHRSADDPRQPIAQTRRQARRHEDRPGAHRPHRPADSRGSRAASARVQPAERARLRHQPRHDARTVQHPPALALPHT